mmetsp:Transcript_15431/g.35227  ORF Transcript_15431/g.35227 Transcript_15431/m.35227 type:complete len:306 (+) Transcript_15431:29-946(+)
MRSNEHELAIDPYAVLGIKSNASPAEVKAAYRQLAKKHHPDKDTTVSAAEATERFQKIQKAYEILIDPAKREALGNRVASTRPYSRAKTPGAKEKAAPCFPRAAGRQWHKKAKKAESACQPTFLVLDSDEEAAAREEEWQARDHAHTENKRRRSQWTAQQARRMQQAAAAKKSKTSAEPSPSANNAAAGNLSFVRLSLKRLLSCQPVTATELERVFAGHGVRVTSLTAATAILSCKHGAALPCALSLHRWKDRSHASADGAILRMVKFAIAPVTAAGRAAAGSQATMLVTANRVTACDREGAKFI